MFDLAAVYKRRDVSAMRSAAGADVAKQLIALCDQAALVFPELRTRAAKPGEFDAEGLFKLGSFLANAGHGDLDAAVLDWLDQDASVDRVIVAFDVLRGMWSHERGNAPPDRHRVERAVDVVGVVEGAASPDGRRAESARQALWPLLGAVVNNTRSSPDAVDAAILAIDRLLSRGLGSPRLDKTLSVYAPQIVDNALRRIGRPPKDWHEFRAYQEEEGGRRSYVLEWCKARSEVARIVGLQLQKRVLMVEFEKTDEDIIDHATARLLFDLILVGLLRDEYRAKADKILWVNTKSAAKFESIAYSAPG